MKYIVRYYYNNSQWKTLVECDEIGIEKLMQLAKEADDPITNIRICLTPKDDPAQKKQKLKIVATMSISNMFEE